MQHWLQLHPSGAEPSVSRDEQGVSKPMTADLTPHFDNVQSHYDLSDDFFRLFLDPT